MLSHLCHLKLSVMDLRGNYIFEPEIYKQMLLNLLGNRSHLLKKLLAVVSIPLTWSSIHRTPAMAKANEAVFHVNTCISRLCISSIVRLCPLVTSLRPAVCRFFSRPVCPIVNRQMTFPFLIYLVSLSFMPKWWRIQVLVRWASITLVRWASITIVRWASITVLLQLSRRPGMLF